MLQFDFNSVLSERLRGNLVLPVALATACLGVGYLCLSSSRRKRLPFPPGPRGLPIVGNAFDVPEKEFWLKHKEWSDEYGSDVIYLNMLGTPVVVLNSHKAVKELLEQRSAIYSSRPNMPMLNDLIGFSWHFGFMEYGSKWKERRQLFQRVLSPNHAQRYRPSFLVTIKTLLNQLLDDPDHFLEHGRRLSGSFILNVTYGLEIKSDDDIYILQAERGMQAMAAAGTASTFLVDFLPSLKYVPSWFPGAGFRRHAKEWSKHVFAMADSPFQYVKGAMASGTAEPCAAVDLLEGLDTDDPENLKHREEVIRDALAAAYAAGSDTVSEGIEVSWGEFSQRIRREFGREIH